MEMIAHENQEGHNSIDKIFEFGSSLLSTSYLIENVFRSYSNMDNIQSWYRSNSQIVEKSMDVFARKGFGLTPFGLLGIFGSSIDIVLSLKYASDAFYQDNPSLAAAHLSHSAINMGITMSFIGDAAHYTMSKHIKNQLENKAFQLANKHLAPAALRKLALSTVMNKLGFGRFLQTTIKFFLPMAASPIGQLLLFADFINIVAIQLLEKSELVKWAQSTPFALSKANQKDIDIEVLTAQFANIITKPTAKILKTNINNQALYYVEILLPIFDAEKHKIQLRAAIIDEESFNSTVTAMPNSWAPARAVYSKEQEIVISHTEAVFDDKLQMQRTRFYLNLNNNSLDNSSIDHKLIAKFKIVLEGGFNLPLRKYKGSYLKHAEKNDQFSESWFHAEPIMILGAKNV